MAKPKRKPRQRTAMADALRNAYVAGAAAGAEEQRKRSAAAVFPLVAHNPSGAAVLAAINTKR